MQEKNQQAERMDYDNLYKTVLKKYFWDGLKLFLPDLYDAVDTNAQPEFLDQEQQKLTFDFGGGAARTDIIALVSLKDGGKEFVICHVEVQGEGGGDLPVRMMLYRDYLHLYYRKEPVGIAVLTEPRPKREKTEYRSSAFGVEAYYGYKNFFVLDTPDEILLSDGNRIGLILYAAKYAYKSGGDEGKKFGYLRLITNMWNERGWNPHDKRIILEAVSYLMNLSDSEYKKQFVEHVENLKMAEEDKKMYQSVFEEVYLERGVQIGEQIGEQVGAEKKAFDIARNFLADGFSIDVVSKNTGLSPDEVKTLLTN
jgi:hypothetical protein